MPAHRRYPHAGSASPPLFAEEGSAAAAAVDVQSELEATTRHPSRLSAGDEMMMAACQGNQLHPPPQSR